MLRKYVANGAWYCGTADDPLMKERAWHGSELRTMVAAMFYMNRGLGGLVELTDMHTWRDRNGNEHDYALSDPDAGI